MNSTYLLIKCNLNIIIKFNYSKELILIIYLYQGCQVRFNKCFIFSIGMEYFSFGAFRGCTAHVYIDIYNSTNIIQIQDKLIMNYAIQIQYQTNIISKFKIFLNSQD
jgi:hypothetical protein